MKTKQNPDACHLAGSCHPKHRSIGIVAPLKRHRLLTHLRLFSLTALVVASTQISWAGWLPAGNLAAARAAHTATLLDNGKILIVGGVQSPSTVLGSCELFDPVTLAVTVAAPLNNPREHHQAVRLPNGKVLVSGGSGPGGTGAGSYLYSTELYDPVANTWSMVASMNAATSDHRLVLLDNGNVLRVCGSDLWGFGTTSCEIYDPVANSWTYTGSTSAGGHSRACVKLSNGRVLTAGGYFFSSAVEEYNPATGSWTLRGNLTHAVAGPVAVQLDDGRVFVMGGEYWSGSHSHYAQVDVYNPTTGTVSPGPSMLVGRAVFQAVKLPGGDVLAISGISSNANVLTTQTCERFSIASGGWSFASPVTVSRSTFQAILVDDGVFVFGGWHQPPGSTTTTASIEMLPLGPQLIYSEDFAASPRWVTDDPAKLRQDPATGTFHGTQVNTEGTYAYVDLPAFNPNAAWRLEWDHRINSCGWSAGFDFGLMDHRVTYPYTYSAGLDMGIGDMGHGTALWGLNGVFSPAWQTGPWYHSVMTYDPLGQQVTLAITNKSTGLRHMVLARTVTAFPANTTRLGVSRVHMKNTGPGADPNATSDYDLDNVRLYGEAAPMLSAGLANTTVSPGGTTELTVKALGSQPLNYQWFFNGGSLSTAGPTLTVANANVSHAGTYCVVVKNAFGAFTNCAYLSVLDLKPFAGIILAGPLGTTYRIEYVNAVGGGNNWQPLSTLTLNTSPTTWIDMASGSLPRRFYRAVPVP